VTLERYPPVIVLTIGTGINRQNDANRQSGAMMARRVFGSLHAAVEHERTGCETNSHPPSLRKQNGTARFRRGDERGPPSSSPDWLQPRASSVHPDPVIRKTQAGLRRYTRHVAIHAIGGRARRTHRLGRKPSPGMAPHALFVIRSRATGAMRIVAGKARQRSTALPEACALAEVHRLMAHIPCVVPVDRRALQNRRTVAFPAEFVQLPGG